MTMMLAAAMALALQEPRLPEEIEPLRIKTAMTLDEGEIQLDFVGSLLEYEDSSLDDLEDFDGTVLGMEAHVAVGLKAWLTAEFRVSFLSLDQEDNGETSGWSQPGVDFKAAVPKDWIPLDHSAFGLRVTLPAGGSDRGLGPEEPEVMLYAAFTQRIESFTIHAQPYVELEDNDDMLVGLNAAAEFYPFASPVAVMLGFNYAREMGEGPEAVIIPGIEYRLPAAGFQAGVGLPFGLTEGAERWGLMLEAEISF